MQDQIRKFLLGSVVAGIVCALLVVDLASLPTISPLVGVAMGGGVVYAIFSGIRGRLGHRMQRFFPYLYTVVGVPLLLRFLDVPTVLEPSVVYVLAMTMLAFLSIKLTGTDDTPAPLGGDEQRSDSKG